MDKGGEFEVLDNFYKINGVRHIYTMTYKPQQNDIVERRNSTLLNMTRLMIAHVDLPMHFWREALLIATFILNIVEIKAKSPTTYEIWTRLKLNLTKFKVYNSKA